MTEETPGRHFHLQTSVNWPLTIGYKNDPFIFGETPNRVQGVVLDATLERNSSPMICVPDL
jgi:hypothetical protein